MFLLVVFFFLASSIRSYSWASFVISGPSQTSCASISQTFSIKFRSGLLAGHSKVVIFTLAIHSFMSFDTWMLQLSCCRMKSFPISLLILRRAFSSSSCLKLSLCYRPFSHSNHIFPLAKIIPQTITPPLPISCLFNTTGSPLFDQVHHPSGPSKLKRFSSVNITFLKSTCFVNHLLALQSCSFVFLC